MKQLFSNNAKATLALAINPASTSITVQAGQGALFPNPVVGKQYFLLTLEISGIVEIVRCVSRTNDILTIDLRGLEGTTASSFVVGSAVECRTTAGTLGAFSKYTEVMYELSSVDLLSTPSSMDGNSYICHSNDDGGNPVIAIKSTASYWRFNTHTEVYISGISSSGTNTVNQITSTSIGSLVGTPASGQYIIQFLTGALAGVVRTITSASSNTVLWSTPLPQAPVVGTDQFEIYKSDVSVINGLLQSTGATLAKSSIIPITATTGGNTLTVGLGVCMLDFRNAALTNGTPVNHLINTNPTLVVPANATLGMTSGVISRLILLAIDNAGTVELAIVNAAGGNVLDESGLITTTTISSAATANNVVYSTTGRTNVPFRVLGFIDISEATAGIWLSTPTVISGSSGLAKMNADTMYTPMAYTQFGSFISTNTTLVATDSGKNFHISAGIATLPAPASGLRYRFIGSTPGGGSVAVPTGTNLQLPDGSSTLNGSLTIPTASTVEFISDGILWAVSVMTGTQIGMPAIYTTGFIRADQPKSSMVSVTSSVAGNAITAGLNPCILNFRSTTLTDGTAVTRMVNNALSITVPATATMGTVSNAKSVLTIIALDNAGTVELGLVNAGNGFNLDETSLISTTAMTTGSNSSNVIYSNSARTGVAFRVVGYVESTQTVAGNWSSAPSKVQGTYSLSFGSAVTLVGTQTLFGQKAPFSGTLTYAATTNYDANVNGQVTYLALAGNTTMGPPTNIVPNALYIMKVYQTIGNNTISWDAAYKFGNLGAPVLSTAIGKTDIISFLGGTSNTLVCLGARLDAI